MTTHSISRLIFSALFFCLMGNVQAAHYKVFLLGGQSNMEGNNALAGQLPPELQGPQEDVLFYYGTTFTLLQPGGGANFGPEVSFGRTIADGLPHENVYLIKHAQGATSLWEQWNLTTGSTYNTFKTIVDFGLDALTRAGHSYEIVGMLWTQGERDALNGRTTVQYEADLNAFIADIRNRYGADLPFFISRLSILQTARDISQVRPAQENVAAADPNAYLIDTDTFTLRTDDLHFEEDGYVNLGVAFGQAYLNSLPVDGSAPSIDTLSPAHTALSVDPTANLSITFSEDIALGTGNITLRQAGGTLVESYDVATPPANLTHAGATITIDPTSLLAPSSGYYVEIDATAIDDHAGNSFAGNNGDGTWSFTTSAADTTPPSIVSLAPTNNATAIKFNANLSITFSENIRFGTGSITLRQSGGALVESVDVAIPTGNLTISGNTLVINPTEDLLPLVGYYVEIAATAIEDHAGNSFAGFTGDGTWRFTATDRLVDDALIIPTSSNSGTSASFSGAGAASWHPYRTIDGSGLSGGEHSSVKETAWMTDFIDPSNSWLQWDLGASYTLSSIHVWNLNNQDDIDCSIRSVDIFYSNDANPGGAGAASWTRLGAGPLELPQAPATGTPNTGFDLATATATILPTTEVRFIRFDVNTNWKGASYRTGLAEIQFFAGPVGPDTFAPGVSAFSPAHTATEVDPASNLVITFNEDVAFGSGTITLRQSGGALVESFDVGASSPGLALSGDTVTINPTADLALLTTYYVEIDGTAIEDLSGNSFAGFSGDGSWRFTTVTPDTTDPGIDALNPANGANGFIPTGNIVISFSEEVVFGSGAIRLLQSGGTLVESFDVASPPAGLTRSGNIITIDPTATLDLSATYYVEIDATAIDDLAGNSFAGFNGDTTWRFTTAAALEVGRVNSAAFINVTNNAVDTTGILDWGYVNLPGERYDGGNAVQGLFERDHVDVIWDDIAGSEGKNLTAQGGTARIGSVTLTGGQNDMSASFLEPASYTVDGVNAYGRYRSGSLNATDLWTLTFNNLGAGTFAVTIFLGALDTQPRVWDMDYSLADGGALITGTVESLSSGLYVDGIAGTDVFCFQIEVTSTSTTSDLSLSFGGVSGSSVANPYLSGYSIREIVPPPPAGTVLILM